MSLTEKLNILLQDENLTTEKLENASGDLFPKIADFLNELESFLIAVDEGECSMGDTMESMEYYLNKIQEK